MLNQTLSLLRAQQATLSLAESCTGGLLSSQITQIPGVSDVFWGAVVAYDNSVKTSLLGIPARFILEWGAVSEAVALQMAIGAKNHMKTTWAIAITGIAGPGGGSPAKPVGTVCLAVVGPGCEMSTQKHFSGDRVQIQLQSAQFAVGLLEGALTNNSTK